MDGVSMTVIETNSNHTHTLLSASSSSSSSFLNGSGQERQESEESEYDKLMKQVYNEYGIEETVNLEDDYDYLEEENEDKEIPVITDYDDGFIATQCVEMENEYDARYTVSELTHILNYYGLKKPKTKQKRCIIERIVDFETCIENRAIVLKRRRAFHLAQELKADPYFGKLLIYP